VPKNVPVGELTTGVKIEQSFTASFDGLQGLAVPIADYQRKNLSNVKISLVDATGKMLATKINLAKDIRSQGFVTLDVSPVPNSMGNEFKVLIEGVNGRPGNSFSTWMSEADAIGGVLKNNDDFMIGDLSFRANYLEPETSSQYIECRQYFDLPK
jgi:hypothetical protein